MAGNSRPSFTKRLKERARQEKRAEKAQKKAMRKLEKQESSDPNDQETNPVVTHDEEGNPVALDFHDF